MSSRRSMMSRGWTPRKWREAGLGEGAGDGLVPQPRGRDVRREDEEQLEGDLDGLAAEEREVVDARLHGDDPAVEQLLRLDELAAEVVDDEDAAVRLHLQGGDVELRLGRELELQVRQRQLAAREDQRPPGEGPAHVAAALGRRGHAVPIAAVFVHRYHELSVDAGVVDADRLAADIDGVRDED